MSLLELASISRSELDTPQSDRLITDRDTLLCQQVLDITEAQIESVIDPDCVADDAGVKAMSLVSTHTRIITSVELTCQYHLMLALGWVARASTVNPFVRRKLHLHHHKFSGTESDLEERGITNGVPWGIKRLVMLGDNMMAVYLRPTEMLRATKAYIKSQKPATAAEARAMGKEQLHAYFPLGTVYYALFHTWVVTHVVLLIASALSFSITLPTWYAGFLNGLNVFAVVYMLPSLLRTFCLHFISSNMHYYGDVEARNVMQQCQVLNPWWLMPMQLFCFNFGSTHAIHHFAVKEPFYIRQWNAKIAHKVMREMGVRFNDIGTFKRANSFKQVTNPAVLVSR